MDAERKMIAHWKDVVSLDMVTVDYQQMVEAPLETGKRLTNFLGATWDEAAAAPEKSTGAVLTASIGRCASRSINRRSIAGKITKPNWRTSPRSNARYLAIRFLDC